MRNPQTHTHTQAYLWPNTHGVTHTWVMPYSPNYVFSGQRKPSFHTGTSMWVPSACTICLGRYHHEIHKCLSDTLWSREKACCQRNKQGHLINPGGVVICSDWQHPSSCTNLGAAHCHKCSGCGKKQSWSSGLRLNTERIRCSYPIIMKLGVAYSQSTGSLTNTHSYPIVSSSVLMQVSAQLVLPLPLIIAPPFMYIQNNTKKSWSENSVLEGTSGPFPKMKSNSFSDYSSHCLFPSSPSQERLENIKQYIISLFHEHHKVIYISLINCSIDSNLFPCTWGTFAMLCTLIWHLPEGS